MENFDEDNWEEVKPKKNFKNHDSVENSSGGDKETDYNAILNLLIPRFKSISKKTADGTVIEVPHRKETVRCSLLNRNFTDKLNITPFENNERLKQMIADIIDANERDAPKTDLKKKIENSNSPAEKAKGSELNKANPNEPKKKFDPKVDKLDQKDQKYQSYQDYSQNNKESQKLSDGEYRSLVADMKEHFIAETISFCHKNKGKPYFLKTLKFNINSKATKQHFQIENQFSLQEMTDLRIDVIESMKLDKRLVFVTTDDKYENEAFKLNEKVIFQAENNYGSGNNGNNNPTKILINQNNQNKQCVYFLP